MLSILAVVALWHLAAFTVLVFSPSGGDVDNDLTPGRYERMPAAAFANVALGGANGAVTLPINFVTPVVRPAVRFVDIAEREGTPHIILEVWVGGEAFNATVPLDRVTWVDSPDKTIGLSFDHTEVEVLYTGQGYNYWRFITFQGARDYQYMSSHNSDGYFTYANPRLLIEEHVTSVVISVPDSDPAWSEVKGKIG